MSGNAAARAAVVVAVDDAGTAADAVEWASAEAATRRCPLRIVHAFHPPPADPYCIAAATDNLLTVRTTAEVVLRKAVARAHSVASDIEVSTTVLRGSPGHALLGQAGGAQLLVLGSRARHGLRGLLTRSVSIHLAAHAACPVVVVRPTQHAQAPGWSPPRVVVGVDATDPSALGFAFGAARQRGLPLFAVRAWTPDRPADLEGISGPTTLAELLARRTLERALESWRPEFPDVAVHTTLVRGNPAQALINQSHRAALLVVGTRGRGHLRGTMLGSVSQTVLAHGHSPIAVVHGTTPAPTAAVADGDPGRARDPGPGRRDTPGDRRWSA
ncbi:universal stress protein [Pseudonocardia sp. KRD291]|uniref:universal stress protein n=1 Tax=Pseudonocardia sp. KRD291 TaxID=2792007 RepID=UPI001C4A1B65|nr:universal stress protein [Pseudonocardia sp. KRD291]MBW0101794.1 universal stress protein [Pseudonocardia sp. KRD291]